MELTIFNYNPRMEDKYEEILELMKIMRIKISNEGEEKIKELENMEELDISSKLIINLPDCFDKFANLKSLKMSWNKISSLPLSFSRT